MKVTHQVLFNPIEKIDDAKTVEQVNPTTDTTKIILPDIGLGHIE